MFTICYKGVYIHCYIDREECNTPCPWTNGRIHHKSLHAAKIYITRHQTKEAAPRPRLRALHTRINGVITRKEEPAS